jgi:ParB-like chromosome segregation protein Spo0J
VETIDISKIVVESWSILQLKPYSRNPRKNDHAIDRMVTSIRKFGFPLPVLARRNGEVIDGHLRLKAARKMGMEQVPVIVCGDWTPEEVKAFRIQVNQSANWAEFDLELLALELADLQELGFDLALTYTPLASIQ